MSQLYPFLFEPNLHSIVWGGHRLLPYKGLPATEEPVGESWEVSAVPSSTSIISNGLYKGHLLNDVISRFPEEILGVSVACEYKNQLPLLVKFIDAEKDLSIQVHPDNEMAQREHGKMGKSEIWYIIDARQDSYLYAGFKKEITPEEYKRHVEEGTIVDVLAKHAVKPGDVFYLPAGRVHAICGGILLAEVQQSSDVTYRIFDYHRPGMDGKPRELHTELAAKALDFRVEEDYRTQYNTQSNRANHVIDSPFFSVRVTEMTGPFHRNLIKYDSFIICMCIEGDCLIRMRESGDEVMLCEGFSTLIPASIADYDVIPLHGKTRILDAYIDKKDRGLGSSITRFLHITSK
ncbi:MAG: mannose-6-phosphate isomerase [Bacteroidales bacterium]|nr:mannose-6-phosphate isomerase [Bacteroidales bacterium]